MAQATDFSVDFGNHVKGLHTIGLFLEYAADISKACILIVNVLLKKKTSDERKNERAQKKRLTAGDLNALDKHRKTHTLSGGQNQLFTRLYVNHAQPAWIGCVGFFPRKHNNPVDGGDVSGRNTKSCANYRLIRTKQMIWNKIACTYYYGYG